MNGFVQPTISIVIPARNEARNLEVLLPELPAVHEVILVDGGSVDDTIPAARRARPGIRIVTQTRRGKGNALVCGFEAATGDIIVMLDADGSADPAEIPAFVEALAAGAEFAKGSRYGVRAGRRGGSADLTVLRNVGNRALTAAVNALFRTRFSDLCYGYNAFRAEILPVLELPPTQLEGATVDGALCWGDGFEIETVLHCRVAAARLAVTEVASVERPRMWGRSNLNAFSDGIRVLRTILWERRRAWRPRSSADHDPHRPDVDGQPPPETSHVRARTR